MVESICILVDEDPWTESERQQIVEEASVENRNSVITGQIEFNTIGMCFKTSLRSFPLLFV